MTHEPRGRSGGQLLVDQLAVHGAELAFGVPGESYIDVLDALRDSPVRFVTCRHEAGAANMAEAYGKLTGRPGICFVTRGPGATQASVGVHTASQDGTPMILLVGQIRRGDVGREAFQELDCELVFGSLAKWVAQVDRTERIPELVARAFRTATSGRPGPVVLALPEDMLAERVEVPDASPYVPAQAAPGEPELAELRQLVAKAERPLAIVGGQPWTAEAGAGLARWLEASGVPVAAAWRCQDYVDNESRCYAGHLSIGPDPALADRLRDADTLLVVGTRLGDIETSGFSTIRPPGAGRTLIHVHPDPNELGRVYEPTLGIVASGPRFAAALDALDPLDRGGEDMDAAHAAYLETFEGRPLPGAVQTTDAMAALRDAARAGRDRRERRRELHGVGPSLLRLPALRHPTRTALGRDGVRAPGGNRREARPPGARRRLHRGRRRLPDERPGAATAHQHGAAIVVLVVDNGMYGTIRMHQERSYPAA